MWQSHMKRNQAPQLSLPLPVAMHGWRALAMLVVLALPSFALGSIPQQWRYLFDYSTTRGDVCLTSDYVGTRHGLRVANAAAILRSPRRAGVLAEERTLAYSHGLLL